MSLFEELIEDLEGDKEIVKSFGSKDTLPDTIFSSENGTYKLKDDIRKKLLEPVFLMFGILSIILEIKFMLN